MTARRNFDPANLAPAHRIPVGFVGPTCPYCGAASQPFTGRAVYPGYSDLAARIFWACAPCDAWVGCHERGSWRIEQGRKIVHLGHEPLGRLADEDLRRAKGRAHAAFDPLWKSKRMTRRDAYRWLSAAMGLPEAHIGQMDATQCRHVELLALAYRETAPMAGHSVSVRHPNRATA